MTSFQCDDNTLFEINPEIDLRDIFDDFRLIELENDIFNTPVEGFEINDISANEPIFMEPIYESFIFGQLFMDDTYNTFLDESAEIHVSSPVQMVDMTTQTENYFQSNYQTTLEDIVMIDNLIEQTNNMYSTTNQKL